MPQWEWKKGMYGIAQPFLIRTPDGDPFDLTGYTVTLYVWDVVLSFSNVGVLDIDPTTGLCYFTPIAADFDTVGTFRFEVEMTDVGKVVKTKNYIVEVTDTRP